MYSRSSKKEEITTEKELTRGKKKAPLGNEKTRGETRVDRKFEEK